MGEKNNLNTVIIKHNIRFIFGMKLKNLRHEKGYGLKDLSELTGISVSYLNEIEKGKKFPKHEKIINLAKGLEVEYDDLVSIKMSGRLGKMSELFSSSSVLGSFPFRLFGISYENVIELFNSSPKKAVALISTLMEISKSYDMNVEQFFLASLRSYQEMHKNYFEEFEKLAEKFASNQKWLRMPPPSREEFIEVLKKKFKCEVRIVDFSKKPEFIEQRFVFLPGKKSQLLLNDQLDPSQHVFSLALQIAHYELNIHKRVRTSPWNEFDSFDHVMESFKASYYAGALVINRFNIEKEIKEIFKLDTWNGDSFIELLKRYEVTPETFLHRLSQILPGLFNITELHYLRFEQVVGNDEIHLTKELNMPRSLVPSGVRLNEHYCQRWLPVSLLKDLELNQKKINSENVFISAQKAHFLESGDKVLFISIGRSLRLRSKINRTVSLGLKIDKNLKEKVKFLKDIQIPESEVNQTCERCFLDENECKERTAHNTVYKRREKEKKLKKSLEKMLINFREKNIEI